MKIVGDETNNLIARKLAEYFNSEPTKVEIGEFPNGEIKLRIEEELEGEEVLLVNSITSPIHKNIIKFQLLADACSWLNPKKIIGVLPWLPYSPQDKIFRKGEPLSSQVLISNLEASQIDEFIVLDLHSQALKSFFTKKIVELDVLPVFADFLEAQIRGNESEWAVVSVDNGNRIRSNELAEKLNIDIHSFSKIRDRHTGKIRYIEFPEELMGKKIVIIDDFISTGSTLVRAASYVKDIGAKRCVCLITHCITRRGLSNVLESSVDQIITTNSIIHPGISNEKLEIRDITPLIARSISEVENGQRK